ncbi:TspO/MBR family protein [Sphingomonas sp. Leaf339]|uniref:TspO/MBR family protein n=1 Tax=Sphingomonas sp. Leaf339 TaxID=1736343 RepID=UPI000AC4994C|nr:TspO/MBR family protein [Sphingomonas sp. Leaf339]
MSAIASKGQLRMSLLRWAVVTVPLVLLLGFASSKTAPAGSDNLWYQALAKPAQTPPDWVFPVAWTTIYILMGVAVAIVLNARGARGRALATGLFMLGFALSLGWMPLFFGAHRVTAAIGLISAMIVFGIGTTIAFARVRTIAAWLMVPYLVWISFAGVLTWSIDQMNPNAETLVPSVRTSQML